MKNLKYFVVAGIVSSLSLNATSLRNSVEDTLNSNPSIIAENLNRDAYKMYVDQEEADFLPTLNLDAYYQNARVEKNTDTTPDQDGWSTNDGWNSILKLEQILYDGGLSTSQVLEYKHKYTSNKYRSLNEVENTILDTVNAYIDLVSRQELVALSEHNIKAHEKYLEMAKEKEAISGEILETYQVQSKYHSVLDSFYEQENEKTQALNLYEQFVGKELEGDICRPVVNKSFLPTTVEDAVKEGLRRSYKLKEQIAKTKEQGAKITQERAGYKPTLKLQLQAELDNDIELEENGRQDTYSARLYLSWNLFQGGKTYYMTEKERIFLKEEQKKLDVITREVTMEIKNAYNTFYNFEKRIKNIELYEEDNFNILKTYKKQLADGTRTFIDILNAEAELYRSSIQKIEQKFDYIESYYELLFNMSMLSDVILMQDKQTCDRYQFIPKNSDVQEDNSNDTLSEDLLNMFDDTPAEDSIQIQEDEDRLKNLYNN